MILLSKNVNKSKLIRVHTPTGCVHRSMDSLPRRENSPPDCFLIRLSSPVSHTKKEVVRSDDLFFGIDYAI